MLVRLIPFCCFLSIVFLLGSIAPAPAQEEIKPFGRRIVGGEPTTIKEHPWQVALNVNLDGQTELAPENCTGR